MTFEACIDRARAPPSSWHVPDDDVVVALYDFTPAVPSKQFLSLCTGQVVVLHNRDVSGWWEGESDGLRGWFPSTYVRAYVYSQEQTTPTAPIRDGLTTRVSEEIYVV